MILEDCITDQCYVRSHLHAGYVTSHLGRLSLLCEMVKWVSTFGRSNNKWWWLSQVPSSLQAGKSVGLVQRSAGCSHQALFCIHSVNWVNSHNDSVSGSQQHKHCPGYYCYYYIIIIICNRLLFLHGNLFWSDLLHIHCEPLSRFPAELCAEWWSSLTAHSTATSPAIYRVGLRLCSGVGHPPLANTTD